MPKGTFHNIEIDAIYFDDGIRIIPESPQTQLLRNRLEKLKEIQKKYQNELNSIEDLEFKEIYKQRIDKLEEEMNILNKEIIKTQLNNIEDLLKLANGAKNIYLFGFYPQKRIVSIELPHSLNPYEPIRDWKRENNLYTSPPLVKEGDYEEFPEEIQKFIEITTPLSKKIIIPCQIKNVIHTFETKEKMFCLVCQDTQPKLALVNQYQMDYIKWLNQCYLKYGCSYSGNEVRNKLGRSNRTLYDENGNSDYYRYEDSGWPWMPDNWYIDGKQCAGTYYQFLDITLPPQKPKELN